MAVKLSQSLKQSQQLTMTPQLQQAIKLLTLTHLEMTNVIAEEMVENPVLEEAEIDRPVEDDSSREGSESSSSQTDIVERIVDGESGKNTKDDFDWNSYIESTSDSTPPPKSMATRDLDEMPNYENIISKGRTLAEHLEWQLRMEELSESEWGLANSIIHNINNDGYLEQPFDELLAETDLSREEGSRIIKIVQRLDPVGCGTQNLAECLLAQASILAQRSPSLELIIREHLPNLQNSNYQLIEKETGLSIERIKDIESMIREFHPRPGRLVASDDIFYVVPDIYVVEAGGEFVVTLNDEGVPRLKVSNLYRSMLEKKGGGGAQEEARDFVQEKLRNALWLIKSIQNRQQTIMKVSKAIVAQQQEFFHKGVEFLKPMVLKNIAEEIGMHESTVSRVTTNKYMHTPIGLFELKYFFNSGVGGKGGGVDISCEVLKLKIKALVENESVAKPLSDQKLAELLSRDGVKIARRTVAKYREMLGILSSSKRKVRG